MTANKYKQTLKEQLLFIDNSCKAYDQGQQAEAIRIGQGLRVLLHTTRESTSLLTHLGHEKVPILSTCAQHILSPRTILFEGLWGVGSYGMGAKLGHTAAKNPMPANEWWHQVVFAQHGIGISRAAIALTAANKLGGAHVDLDLSPIHQKMVDGLWNSQSGPIAGHHLFYLRQMGYEIANSPDLLALAK